MATAHHSAPTDYHQEVTKNMKTEKQKQQDYLERIRAGARVPDIVQGEQFIAGMRKLGYRDTGHALDELVDNSLEAGATKCMVAFGFTGKSSAKPTELAVVDNGLGMPKDLIRHAVVWGGTHRHDSRDFFGRFGFGLPSASMSIGKRFEVYSKQDGGPWFMVPIDLDEIVEGHAAYRDESGRVVPPKPTQVDPPFWVVSDCADQLDLSAIESGTVVVIKKIDNLTNSTAQALQNFLLNHFGTTYRNFLDRMKIWVNGAAVDAVDPLFLTPTARFFEVENDKLAEPLPELRIPVEYERNGKKGKDEIVCRFSYLPYGFMRLPLEEEAGGKGAIHKGRQAVMKDNLGVIFLRQGRQIEVVSSRCPWTKFQNNDMSCRIEVNFPPVLDELFDVPTNKQQVVPSEHIWALLKNAGVAQALDDMRKRYSKEAAAAKANAEHLASGGAPSPAEAAMGEVGRTITKRPQTPRRQAESEELVEGRARQKAIQTGVPLDEAREQVRAELDSRKYRVTFESLAEGPFYTCRHPGGCVELVINTAHRFFTDVYSAPSADARTRAGLESLLFVLSVRELEVGDELQEIYCQERVHWSSLYGRVLRALEDKFDSIEDSQNVANQMAEDEEGSADDDTEGM